MSPGTGCGASVPGGAQGRLVWCWAAGSGFSPGSSGVGRGDPKGASPGVSVSLQPTFGHTRIKRTACVRVMKKLAGGHGQSLLEVARGFFSPFSEASAHGVIAARSSSSCSPPGPGPGPASSQKMGFGAALLLLLAKFCPCKLQESREGFGPLCGHLTEPVQDRHAAICGVPLSSQIPPLIPFRSAFELVLGSGVMKVIRDGFGVLT